MEDFIPHNIQRLKMADSKQTSIIYLDIDGVLNIDSDYYKTEYQDGNIGIENSLLRRFEYIVGMTGADIIILSEYNIDTIIKSLARHNFKYFNKIITNIDTENKRKVIAVRENSYDTHNHNFIVLSNDIGLSDIFEVCEEDRPNFIRVDRIEGLTHKDAVDSINRLFQFKDIKEVIENLKTFKWD